MIIQYASDLHLEFKANKLFLQCNPLLPVGDVLILTGDVMPFIDLDKHQEFFDYISDHFHTTYWIPGNHEYFHFDLSKKCGALNEAIRKNVHLVNNITITQDGIRFIFSTLWSHISPAIQSELQNNLHDFQVINYHTAQFNVTQYNQQHQACLDFITLTLLQKVSEKTVVVTHHVPTLRNYPEKYKGTAMREAFVVALDDLIAATQPSCWIYGHHHFNTLDFKIGNTKLLTNQLGYVRVGGDRYFSNDKTFEL